MNTSGSVFKPVGMASAAVGAPLQFANGVVTQHLPRANSGHVVSNADTSPMMFGIGSDSNLGRDESSNGTAAKERRRIGAACTTCRRRKRKCDGGQPACALCVKLGIESDCTYGKALRKRGPPAGQVSALKQEVKRLKSIVHELQSQFATKMTASQALSNQGCCDPGSSPAALSSLSPVSSSDSGIAPLSTSSSIAGSTPSEVQRAVAEFVRVDTEMGASPYFPNAMVPCEAMEKLLASHSGSKESLYVRIYFLGINPQFPMLDEIDFRRRLILYGASQQGTGPASSASSSDTTTPSAASSGAGVAADGKAGSAANPVRASALDSTVGPLPAEMERLAFKVQYIAAVAMGAQIHRQFEYSLNAINHACHLITDLYAAPSEETARGLIMLAFYFVSTLQSSRASCYLALFSRMASTVAVSRKLLLLHSFLDGMLHWPVWLFSLGASGPSSRVLTAPNSSGGGWIPESLDQGIERSLVKVAPPGTSPALRRKFATDALFAALDACHSMHAKLYLLMCHIASDCVSFDGATSKRINRFLSDLDLYFVRENLQYGRLLIRGLQTIVLVVSQLAYTAEYRPQTVSSANLVTQFLRGRAEHCPFTASIIYMVSWVHLEEGNVDLLQMDLSAMRHLAATWPFAKTSLEILQNSLHVHPSVSLKLNALSRPLSLQSEQLMMLQHAQQSERRVQVLPQPLSQQQQQNMLSDYQQADTSSASSPSYRVGSGTADDPVVLSQPHLVVPDDVDYQLQRADVAMQRFYGLQGQSLLPQPGASTRVPLHQQLQQHTAQTTSTGPAGISMLDLRTTSRYNALDADALFARKAELAAAGKLGDLSAQQQSSSYQQSMTQGDWLHVTAGASYTGNSVTVPISDMSYSSSAAMNNTSACMDAAGGLTDYTTFLVGDAGCADSQYPNAELPLFSSSSGSTNDLAAACPDMMDSVASADAVDVASTIGTHSWGSAASPYSQKPRGDSFEDGDRTSVYTASPHAVDGSCNSNAMSSESASEPLVMVGHTTSSVHGTAATFTVGSVNSSSPHLKFSATQQRLTYTVAGSKQPLHSSVNKLSVTVPSMTTLSSSAEGIGSSSPFVSSGSAANPLLVGFGLSTGMLPGGLYAPCASPSAPGVSIQAVGMDGLFTPGVGGDLNSSGSMGQLSNTRHGDSNGLASPFSAFGAPSNFNLTDSA